MEHNKYRAPIEAKNQRAREHETDADRLLVRLREAGAAGVTTGELIREGFYGLRPPNRVGDLRKRGCEIQTIAEPGGVFRFVLISEPATLKPLPRFEARSRDLEARALPLFAGAESGVC